MLDLYFHIKLQINMQSLLKIVHYELTSHDFSQKGFVLWV